MQRYIIEYGSICEEFQGEDATEWFWACLDAIKDLMEDWHIYKPPKYIRIAVRRELNDKGPVPWLTVKNFEMTPQAPWIDLEWFEEHRVHLYMIGQAMALAWRDPTSRKIVDQYLEKICHERVQQN